VEDQNKTKLQKGEVIRMTVDLFASWFGVII